MKEYKDKCHPIVSNDKHVLTKLDSMEIETTTVKNY